eukprot:2937664-Alexandrium_andersonii.AAC.1
MRAFLWTPCTTTEKHGVFQVTSATCNLAARDCAWAWRSVGMEPGAAAISSASTDALGRRIEYRTSTPDPN